MARSASGESQYKFQRMLDQLNGVFSPGIELTDINSEFGVKIYYLRLAMRSELMQAVKIILDSGLVLDEAVYAISTYLSQTGSCFEWDDLGITRISPIEPSVRCEEDDEGLHYGIYIEKLF